MDLGPGSKAAGDAEEAAATEGRNEAKSDSLDETKTEAENGKSNSASNDNRATRDTEEAATEDRKAKSDGFDETTQTENGKSSNTSTNTKVAQDPLRWFGILVPSALRSSQSAFVSAVEGAVPELATLADSLRKQEIKIQRLRKQIRKL
jgi:hypothetical protein